MLVIAAFSLLLFMGVLLLVIIRTVTGSVAKEVENQVDVGQKMLRN
ncbi:MAG: hypothetical protein JO140_03475 [Candidatus Eremiobacteraeota bacterium]|nr:hypothetical protein [Candidatus Eremiobacteraeota bacterium]